MINDDKSVNKADRVLSSARSPAPSLAVCDFLCLNFPFRAQCFKGNLFSSSSSRKALDFFQSLPELIAIVSVRRGEVSTAPQPLKAFTVISRHSALLVGDPPRCCTRSLVFCAAHCAVRSSSSPLFLDFPTLFVQAVRGAVVRAALSCNVSVDVALLVWHLWCTSRRPQAWALGSAVMQKRKKKRVPTTLFPPRSLHRHVLFRAASSGA